MRKTSLQIQELFRSGSQEERQKRLKQMAARLSACEIPEKEEAVCPPRRAPRSTAG